MRPGPEGARRRLGRRSTPPGGHVPVMRDTVLGMLAPQPGDVILDATIGLGGHARLLLEKAGPTGRLIGLDLDAENLERARAALTPLALPFTLHQTNFAAAAQVVAAAGLEGVDCLLADLGVASTQIDDPERGFSYARPGPLDMRMDRRRGRTAAEVLATISEEELRTALLELGDEPHAGPIARAIVSRRAEQPLVTTLDLVRLIGEVVGQPVERDRGWKLRDRQGHWKLHPAARTFQALRILVNRELASLEHLLRLLPNLLRPGGRAAIISFHSGEDRLVKSAFKEGLARGLYAAISPDPLRACFAEKQANPRARSAKLRWARR